MNTTLERIKTVLADQLGVTESEIKPDSRPIADLCADSIDTIEIAMQIEDQWNIEVPDEDFAMVETVEDAVKLVDSIVSGNGSVSYDEPEERN